jgi:hypothetical protein
MYYTNIKDFEQLKRQPKEDVSMKSVVPAIVLGLVIALLI